MNTTISKFSGLSEARGHHFYAKSLNQNSIVFDLGSHLGEFSAEISQTFGCKCYAVEALPLLYEKIEESSLIKKFNYAITDTEKLVKFFVSDNLEASYISNSELQDNKKKNEIIIHGISLYQLIKNQGINHIDLLKIDIEGSEIQLFESISDDTLQNIAQISIEFHDFILDIKSEVKYITSRLKSLGFICIRYSFFTNGDVLFLNANKLNINLFQSLYIRFLSRYIRGFTRATKKYLKMPLPMKNRNAIE